MIALTGASGHIASALLPLLISRDYRIKTLVHNQIPTFSHPAVQPVQGSLSEPDSLKKLVEGCRFVIHGAARISIRSNRDQELYRTNVDGTISLYEAARRAGVQRFVQISSIHAYDQLAAGKVLSETSPYCPDHAPQYDRSKRDAQRWLLEQSGSDMEVVVVNPTAVAGPHDYKPSLIGQAVIDLYKQKIPLLIEGGFDFVDVRDVAAGTLAAMESGRHQQAYLLPGKWHSLAELQQIVLNSRGINGAVKVLPAWTGFAGLPFIQVHALIRNREPLYTREALTAIVQGHRNISGAKAATELGYQTRDLTDTINDTIDWFKQTGYL